MKPIFEVLAGEDDVTRRVRDYLVELRVVLTADRTSDHVEISLADDAGALAVPARGRELRVAIGYEGRGLVSMGVYSHTDSDIELVPRLLRIRGAGADFRGSSTLKAPQTRAWDDVTLGEVVEKIAAEHGYEAAVAPALKAERIEHIDQTAESDLHLLRRLARHYDATAQAAAGVLVFAAAGASVNPSGSALPNVRVVAPAPGVRATLTRGSVSRKDRSSYGSVRASYHDAGAGTTRHVLAGSGAPVYEIRNPRPDRAQAIADARAKLARLTRSTAELSLAMPGNPEAVAGGRVTTEGWGAGADAAWTVTRVTHTISKQGYSTELSAELAPST